MFHRHKLTFTYSPSDETHDITIHRHSVNSFFAISEFVFQKAFAAAMKSNSSYEDFADRIIRQLVPDFMVAVGKLITAVHHVLTGHIHLNGGSAQGTAPPHQRKVAIAAVGRWPWRVHSSARRAGSGSAPGAMPSSSAWMPRVTSRLS
jgi:hypothetical protein